MISWVLCDELHVQLAGKGAEDLVFASPEGSCLRVANWRRHCFDKATTDIGVGGLVPHALRHTAASLAIASGAGVLTIQRMLGHASAAMTLDRYGHLMGDELDAVARQLDIARTSACARKVPQASYTNTSRS